MRPGLLRVIALCAASAVATPLLVSTVTAHDVAHSSGVLSIVGAFAVPTVLAISSALVAVARVVAGKAHPLKGGGRYLLGCCIVPLAAWMAYSAGPHAGASVLVFWFGAFVVTSLFVSSLIAAAPTN
jgi:hypothetical protein